MVGTTFKLGFDAGAVKQGLSKLGGSLKGFREQVGIGSARQVGAKMTDWVGRLISIIPEAASETMNWAGSLVDLSNQTGATVKDLMILQEAFARTGMESIDAGKMIGTMRTSIYDATHGDQGLQEAFAGLKINANDLKGAGPIEQIRLIMQQASNLRGVLEDGAIEKHLGNIFGGKIGIKTLRGMGDPTSWKKMWDDASKSLGSQADMTKEQLANMDDLGDKISSVIEIQKRGLVSSLLEGMFGKDMSSGMKLAQSISDLMQSMRPAIKELGELFQSIIKSFPVMIDSLAKNGIGGTLSLAFSAMGEAFGNGIKSAFIPKELSGIAGAIGKPFESMGSGFTNLTGGAAYGTGKSVSLGGPDGGLGIGISQSLADSVMSAFGMGPKSELGVKPLIGETEKQTGILERIADKITPVFSIFQ